MIVTFFLLVTIFVRDGPMKCEFCIFTLICSFLLKVFCVGCLHWSVEIRHKEAALVQPILLPPPYCQADVHICFLIIQFTGPRRYLNTPP